MNLILINYITTVLNILAYFSLGAVTMLLIKKFRRKFKNKSSSSESDDSNGDDSNDDINYYL